MSRIFLLATIILSLVLGLGFMLRPLRHFGINPARVPELILCTLPITMTMVLPIAALLATTLVYGRLAMFNEITASRSSGICLTTLIYPALTLALSVGMVTLLLGFHVIPYFIARSERIFTDDAKSIIYRNIEKKGNLGKMFPGMKVYADRADPASNSLLGVAVIFQGKNDSAAEIITAGKVELELQAGERLEQILLRLYDFKSVKEGQVYQHKLATLSIPVPSLFRDDIKFKTLSELKAIEQDMTLFSPIRRDLKAYQQRFIIDSFFQDCQRHFKEDGFIDLTWRDTHRIRIHATGLQRFTKGKQARLHAREGSKVKVEFFYRIADVWPEKTYEADQVILSALKTAAHAVLLNLKMEGISVTYRNDQRRANLSNFSFKALTIPATITAAANKITLDEVLNSDIPLKLESHSKQLRDLHNYIREECRELLAEIRSELHLRLAFGFSCVVLVLLGAGLGIVFRSSHLLLAFGICFIPAALCLIAIFTGKHVAEQNPGHMMTGIAILWSGIALMAIANVIVYKALLKH